MDDMENWLISLSIVAIIVVVLLMFNADAKYNMNVTAAPMSNDTWEPVDKVWVYQPNSYQDARNHNTGHIVFFVTYENQNGHHEIREVDIDTWYNSYPLAYKSQMYYQGALI